MLQTLLLIISCLVVSGTFLGVLLQALTHIVIQLDCGRCCQFTDCLQDWSLISQVKSFSDYFETMVWPLKLQATFIRPSTSLTTWINPPIQEASELSCSTISSMFRSLRTASAFGWLMGPHNLIICREFILNRSGCHLRRCWLHIFMNSNSKFNFNQ